jgi:hypothetical protein
MPEDMYCPDCKVLYTYQHELGGLGCTRCGRPRVSNEVQGNAAGTADRLVPVEERVNSPPVSLDGSNPPPCVKVEGEFSGSQSLS